jgi:uncharacterized repeat protein (TIGR02543 family)
VILTANPNKGFRFIRWELDVTGFTSPVTVTMDVSKTVRAVFAPEGFLLTVNLSPTDGGSVSQLPTGPTYAPGTQVHLIATPAPGYDFVTWQGHATGANPSVTVTMDADKLVTAVFQLKQLTLTTSVSPVGAGSIAATPSQATYGYGSSVSLTANPASGYVFDHWELDASGNTNPFVVVMNANKSVRAVFVRKTYTLSASVTPVDSGTVSASPAQGPYAHGTQVTLTASPKTGYAFDHWSGSVSGANSVLTITMDGNKQVIAVFKPLDYTLSVGVSPANSGAVQISPQGPQYAYNTMVSLVATPAADYLFDHWEGGVTGNNVSATLTIKGNTSVTAVFVKQAYTLAAQVAPQGGGTLAINPPNGPYAPGTAVSIHAIPTPGSGYLFSHWEGDATNSVNPLTLTMDGNKTVTAVFTKKVYSLTLAASPLEGGSVAPNPQQSQYGDGTVVSLTATAAQGFLFSHWEGGLTGEQNPGSMTIDSNKSVTAVFVRVYSLAVSVTPSGSGSVLASPFDGPYAAGTVVTLTPAPAPGYAFSHWEGDLTGSAGPAAVTMNGNKAITAVFVRQNYTLTVVVTPTGGGSVVAAPEDPYTYGTVVTLTATPAAQRAARTRWSRLP